MKPLQWRHNDRDGVSYHRRLNCLRNRLFRCISQKTSKLCVTGLCVRNSPVTGELSTQKASNAENASIWWRHHRTGTNYINISSPMFRESQLAYIPQLVWKKISMASYKMRYDIRWTAYNTKMTKNVSHNINSQNILTWVRYFFFIRVHDLWRC